MDFDVRLNLDDESSDSGSLVDHIVLPVDTDEEDHYLEMTNSPKVNIVGINTWRNADAKPLTGPPSSSNYNSSTNLMCEENEQVPIQKISGTSEAGVCGLWNLGNTCFMSAGVQCLMATSPIVANLINSPPIPSHQTLTLALADLAKNIWSGKHHTVRPINFKKSLGKHFPQFNDYRQHDCQEFLALLLNGLHEQMNTAIKNKSCNNFDCFEEGNELKKMNFLEQQPLSLCDNIQSTSSKCGEIVRQEEYNNANVEKCNTIKAFANNCSETSTGSILKDKCDKKYDMQLNNSNISLPENQVKLNNTSRTTFTGLEDIIKEQTVAGSKNVLITDEEANNELRFDSEKYPRTELLIRNTNSFHLYENNTGGKRCKTTVTHFSNPTELKDGLDLKRVKFNLSPSDEGKNTKMEKERLESSKQFLLEKNQRMECERIESEFEGKGEGSSSENTSCSNLLFEASGELKADKHWQEHLSTNRSIVIDTFQGQFKSTVICATCEFVSVTYEPFMYLSVPLPNVMQKIINVTYVSDVGKIPRVYTLEMNRYCDNIATLKHRLLNDLDVESPSSIVIAEVFHHHISKLLDDNYLLKHLNHSDRYLYAFKIIKLKDDNKEIYTDIKNEDNMKDHRCIICLDEANSTMKQHQGCSCIFCDTCFKNYFDHYETEKKSVKCPSCLLSITCDDLCPIKIDKQITTRVLNIPLVFRLDTVGDGNNNQKSVQLFGHPKLLQLPNLCPRDSLKKTIANISPYSEPYRLLLVDGKGDRCSRCMFNAHCNGCEVNEVDRIQLKHGDSLALSFSSPVDTSLETSLNEKLFEDQQPMITLDECILSFSKSELLDSSNPWYCPQCEENRCATKTMTVWRYPDYLIVHLKRFVFHNHISTKLEEKVYFPITGLSLASCDSDYDLYACVCHVGGVSSGHYTSYTQHPETGEWHYFNDNEFVKKCPQDEEYSNAYILFYKKQST